MPLQPTLLLPPRYVSDAAKHIRGASSRVTFLSMILSDDPTSDELLDALADAAERGVVVEMAADIFTYAELGGFFFPSQYKTRQSRSSTRMGKRLQKSGVKFTWLGRSNATIFSGRTHLKMCIVDDIVYAFGGVNVYQSGIENNDYMFKVQDASLAEKLVAEYARLTRADAGDYAYRSHSFTHQNSSILIDGGIVGDSIIYRRACSLASEATNILFVSQYCPNGKLARILKSKKALLYFNQPSYAKGLNKIAISFAMFFTGLGTLYSRSRYLHSKYMIFTMPDGRKIALTGSHNFSGTGVLLGTREIALETEEPSTISQLEDFWKQHVA